MSESRLISGRFSLRFAGKIALILLALAVALFPIPAAWVERFYSNGIYPNLQSLITPATNLLPFALLDLLMAALVLAVPAWWIIRLRAAGRGRRLRASLGLLFQTVVFAAATYLIFEAAWGLNYLRLPLPVKLEYDEHRLTPESAGQLRRATVEQLNAISDESHSQPWPDDEQLRRRLHQPFEAAVKAMGNSRGIAPAVPKGSLFNFYLAAAGIDGLMNPFGYEVILDSELLPIEKPFLLAHEWAHLAGFADESEASFVGLVACMRSDDAALRYAGLLALYLHLPRQAAESADEKNPAEARFVLAPDVIQDLRAISERANRHVNVKISQAQAQLYDKFLKANRVEAGINSYNLLVRLVLGTRFDPEWVPVRRE